VKHANGPSASARARVDEAEADHVTIAQSAVRSVDGEQVQLSRSAVRNLHATQLTAERSFIGVARVDQGTLRQSQAGVVAARSVACDQVRTFILASPVVRGEVRTLIDLRSAVAIGVGMALGRALLAGGRALARKAFG
jgi:hypothetical protein